MCHFVQNHDGFFLNTCTAFVRLLLLEGAALHSTKCSIQRGCLIRGNAANWSLLFRDTSGQIPKDEENQDGLSHQLLYSEWPAKLKSKDLTLWVLSHWRSEIKPGPPAASSDFHHQHTRQQPCAQTCRARGVEPASTFGSRQSDQGHRCKSQTLSSGSGSRYVNCIPSPRLHTSKTAFATAGICRARSSW